MTRIWFRLMLILFVILAAMLIEVIMLPLPRPANTLMQPYVDYMPGSGGWNTNRKCGVNIPYWSEEWHGIYCAVDTPPVYAVSATLNANDVILDSYLFVKQCSVNAGDIILAMAASVKVINHHARKIVWKGGSAYAWGKRGTLYSPFSCVFGVYFSGE